jgi:hypothetical protein
MPEIKIQRAFPYYLKFAAHFPITESTIFVFEDTIYTNNPIPYDIMFHERIHLAQQKKHGAKNWINNYIKDKQFRLAQEVEAYREQLKFVLKETKDRQEYAHILTESATNLSSPLYGSLISYPEAIKILKI